MRDAPEPELTITQALAILGFAFALLQVGVFVSALAIASATGGRVDDVIAQPLFLGLGQALALGPAILLGGTLRSRIRGIDVTAALGLSRVRPRAWAMAALAGASFQFPFLTLMTALGEVLPALARDPALEARLEELLRIDGPARALIVPFAVAVTPAVTEELLFRGLLLPAMRARMSAPAAIWLSSLAFGIFHLEPTAVVYATLAGLFLGTLALRAKSIVPSIAFHAAFNGVPLVITALAAQAGTTTAGEESLPWPLVATATAIGVLALGFFWGATVRKRAPLPATDLEPPPPIDQ